MYRPLLPHPVDRASLPSGGPVPSPSSAAEPVSVVICDEHRLFADAFSAALRQQGADVLATTDPDEARRLALTHSPCSVVLNVLRTPVPTVQALRAIRRHRPGTRLICLVGNDPEAGRLWLDAGADLVLSKRQPLQELVDCVLAASPALEAPAGWPGQRFPDGPGAATRLRVSNASPLAARFLTDREREVLRLLVAAESTKAIARRLGISVPTARRHIQSTFTKLGVHSRVEAVTFAVRHAIVEL